MRKSHRFDDEQHAKRKLLVLEAHDQDTEPVLENVRKHRGSVDTVGDLARDHVELKEVPESAGLGSTT